MEKRIEELEKVLCEVTSYLIADDPDAAYRVIEEYRKPVNPE